MIRTPRLTLRPLDESHADDLWPFVSDPGLPRFMSWSAHKDRSETLAFIRSQVAARAQGTAMSWAIEHQGHASGCIGLDDLVRTMRALRVDRAELGYWLAPALHGRGLMTEAAQAVIAMAFGELGLHKLTVRCFEENVASRRVIEKCGFRLVGRAEDDVWRDGRWWTHLCYELLNARR